MRTHRELLIECINQLKHIDDVNGIKPLATTESLIREIELALNMSGVIRSVCCNAPILNWKSRGKEFCSKCGDEHT